MYKNNLKHLLIYRNILQDEIVQNMQRILAQPDQTTVGYELASQLMAAAEERSLGGNLLRVYLLHLLAKDDNVFSQACSQAGGQLQENSSLYVAALHDIKIIREFLQHGVSELSKLPPLQFINQYVPQGKTSAPVHGLPDGVFDEAGGNPAAAVKVLCGFYAQHGCGVMSSYRAFRWYSELGLQGISQCDPITLTDITGYERQKQVLTDNTRAFLAGKPANNVLLTGSPGTGKSSSVKALLNESFASNLRLIEVFKHELKSLPRLLQLLGRHHQKFIIFLDDLSFEEFESEYKYLKSILDGGIEAKPANVLIYATSNRIHLIKESWDDRKGSVEEIHRLDTMNEKISLSDRFGITLSYFTPNQNEYLAIVGQLAAKHNIALPVDEMTAAALRWEREHNGRSGRTAQQFINQLLSK